jgi:3-deoxy-D-manno-octulosonate 8-phosphate phosphatase (KDO 8-P phosphatase)
VDGVLTNATVTVSGDGPEMKTFNIQDGLGLVSLRESGIPVGWISNRPSAATTARASELKIDYLAQSKSSKVSAIEEILRRAKLDWTQVCYMGDDIVDLGAMRRAGVAVAPANAVPEALAAAHHTTKAAGGCGAVREVCELILKAQGKWAVILARHEK